MGIGLVIWGERLKGSDEITVQLGGSCPAVKVYDPTIGTEPIQTPGDVDSLKLTLSDHPLIIAVEGDSRFHVRKWPAIYWPRLQ